MDEIRNPKIKAALEAARERLARARGMTDLAVMVEAFKDYDGPEVSGSDESMGMHRRKIAE